MAILGCIQAKMGGTIYYICKMATGELIDIVPVRCYVPLYNKMSHFLSVFLPFPWRHNTGSYRHEKRSLLPVGKRHRQGLGERF